MSVLKIKDANGNWQDIPAIKGAKGDTGNAGQNGITPTIGNNGNWYLGDTDTGKPSRGIQGETGQTGATGPAGRDGTNGTNGRDGYVQYTAGDNITIQNNVISATGGSGNFLGSVSDYSSSNRIDLNKLDVGIYYLYIQDGSYGTYNFYFKASKDGVETTLDTSITMTSPILYNAVELCVYNKISDIVSNQVVLEMHYVQIVSSNYQIRRNVKEVKYNASTNTLTSSSVDTQTLKTISTDTNQTISGKKTFSTLPESSVTPTANNQLVNKSYVDDITGDLTDLDTTDKTSLVNAINEVASGGDLSDYYTKSEINNKFYENNAIYTLNAELGSTLNTSVGQYYLYLSNSLFTALWNIYDDAVAKNYDNITIRISDTTPSSRIPYIELSGQVLKINNNWGRLYSVSPVKGDNSNGGSIRNKLLDAQLMLSPSANTSYIVFSEVGNLTYYLRKDNATSYNPTPNSYNPATTKYVDSAIASAITTTLGGSY